jgi:hypothetical protein
MEIVCQKNGGLKVRVFKAPSLCHSERKSEGSREYSGSIDGADVGDPHGPWVSYSHSFIENGNKKG